MIARVFIKSVVKISTICTSLRTLMFVNHSSYSRLDLLIFVIYWRIGKIRINMHRLIRRKGVFAPLPGGRIFINVIIKILLSNKPHSLRVILWNTKCNRRTHLCICEDAPHQSQGGVRCEVIFEGKCFTFFV